MVATIASALAAYRQPSLNAASLDAKTNAASGTSFSDTLGSFMKDTVSSLKQSEDMTQQAATGKANLQDVVVAVSNAEVMLQTVTAIRDKVISAYQEIMRTSV